MADMPHWNSFVKEMLERPQDRPDKGDKGSLHAQFDIIKRVENNSNFLEKERLKDGESK